ncbi:MAG: hypothetical protein ACLU3F_12905 [Blautia wexlerae]
MPKEIFEVVRERFHLSDRTQYIVQGHWPKDAVMEAYLDQHKLKVSVKENENVSALERFKDPEKMQGIQITATVQIPENLEGYHKLVIYEKFPDKKHVWFSITAGELDKKEINRRYILKKRVQNRELYGSEGGPLHRSL